MNLSFSVQLYPFVLFQSQSYYSDVITTIPYLSRYQVLSYVDFSLCEYFSQFHSLFKYGLRKSIHFISRKFGHDFKVISRYDIVTLIYQQDLTISGHAMQ